MSQALKVGASSFFSRPLIALSCSPGAFLVSRIVPPASLGCQTSPRREADITTFLWGTTAAVSSSLSARLMRSAACRHVLQALSHLIEARTSSDDESALSAVAMKYENRMTWSQLRTICRKYCIPFPSLDPGRILCREKEEIQEY